MVRLLGALTTFWHRSLSPPPSSTSQLPQRSPTSSSSLSLSSSPSLSPLLIIIRLLLLFVLLADDVSSYTPPWTEIDLGSGRPLGVITTSYAWIVLVGVSALTPSLVFGHMCQHRSPKADEVIHDVHLEPAHIIRKRSVDQPLRIYLHYDKSVSLLPSRKYRDLLQKDILPKAVRYWQDTLRVRATRVPIRLRRKCKSGKVGYENQTLFCRGECDKKTICGDITIPEEHLETCFCVDCDESSKGTRGPGVSNADFILYVATLSSERCRHGNTVAYAAYCQQERALDRPVAGYFSICPYFLSTSPQQTKQLLSTIKHEILHALGFTAGLYAFYRDQDGNPLTTREGYDNKPIYNRTLDLYQPSEKVVRRIERPNWLLQSGQENRSVWMIVTPKVVEEVRRHFNCSTLEGAELEDQLMNGKTLADGLIDGTAFTHWEKRVFENEAMTGTYTQNPVISRITLALMEDTGWYRVNYDNAKEYEWGKDLGCDFVKTNCYEWIKNKSERKESIHPFCNQVKWGQLHTDCTNNRHSVAVCNLVQHKSPLPEKYQHFSELEGVSSDDVKRFGGSVDLADHCPYLQELLWKSGDSSIRGSRCTEEHNNLDVKHNYFLEKYGNTSRCFNHDGMWHLQHCGKTVQTQHMGSGCYEFECDPEEGLSIIVQSKRHRCYKEGQRVSIFYDSTQLRHQGSIICPACDEICQELGIPCPAETEPPEIKVDTSNSLPPYPCHGTFLRVTDIFHVCYISVQVLLTQILIAKLSPTDILFNIF
ncbi:leishmanolysin-like peptidase [Octopus sinensis]|uniref:Leishmanolysin-like peptidase n=1 Tax=Octopus sinensis TaxID=2607531 RepID=A0A6P7T739_9MOLL|nr:leishmanolysin-like peptidase [Octopus sinensis]